MKVQRSRNFELPSSYGSHLWNFLAQFGRCWTDQDHWLSTISFITNCLDPQQSGNHGSGCERCFGHWNQLLKAVPPSKVQDSTEAGVWVHFIHNQVNRLATPPKKPIPYNEAAQIPGYGWIALKDEEYFKILEGFGVKVQRKVRKVAAGEKSNRQNNPGR